MRIFLSWPELWPLAIRVVVMYGAVLAATRLSGKRELGQVSPFDFVVAVMLGDLAVITIEDGDKALFYGLVPLAIIVVLEVLVAWLAQKSRPLRYLISGKPVMLMADGQILADGLRRARMTVEDLQAALRENGFFRVSDVNYALIENNGKVSVLPKSQHRPVQPADLGLVTAYEAIPATLVADGRVDHQVLDRLGRDEEWLRRQLASQGVSDPRQALLVSFDMGGKWFVSLWPPSPQVPRRRAAR
ncbi:MAG: DUF421 domain-containing protein [Firmicutes bacterium]|nr:DUF421 domain-containing protein [Bacillota bacterium]